MVEQAALLSAEKIQALQTEAFADDVPIAECGDWVRLKTGGWVELDAFLAG